MSRFRSVGPPASRRFTAGRSHSGQGGHAGRGGRDVANCFRDRDGQDLRDWYRRQAGQDPEPRGRRGRWLARRRPGHEQPGSPHPDPLASVLGLACSLAPGQAAVLTEAVLARVRRADGPVVTVALDLAAVADIGQEECAALRALHDRLVASGTRLRLAAASRSVLDRLGEEGVVSHLGADVIHPTLRSALLAGFATLPGPGLVTTSVREALVQPPEPLDEATGPLGEAAEPCDEATGPVGEAAEPWGRAAGAMDGVTGPYRDAARLGRTAPPLSHLRGGVLTLPGQAAPGGASPAADGAR